MKHTMFSPLVAVICAVIALPAAATVTIDWAMVGDVNNPADPSTGYGAVDYRYEIAKYEVTLGQYTEFLNATAASDPHGLYQNTMGTNLNIAGISRSGSSGAYTYATLGSANRPVTYVSWFAAARMANWMHNGQGGGSTETGAYNLLGANTGVFIAQPGAFMRLPTENEWYKAAYYDPTPGAGGADHYWQYPTRSNVVPSNDLPGAGNNANFYDSGYTLATGNKLTEVGAFTGSASHYGTFDQGGNVWEWNDAVIGSSRGLRGGYWDFFGNNLRSSFRSSLAPVSGTDTIGFRFVAVPEPGAGLLALLAAGLGLARRRRPAGNSQPTMAK